MNRITDKIFAYIVPRKGKIITGFKAVYFLISVFAFFAARSLYYQDGNASLFYGLGVNSGQAALVCYIITLIPGMMGRYGVRNKFLSLLTIFRRYVGILMYLFALMHSFLVRWVFFISTRIFIPLVLFEIFGLTALTLLFFLFITSNEYSVVKLGKWWSRIHKLTYIAMGFIFLHVALQRVSIWSVAMGIIIVLEVGSVVNMLSRRFKKR